MDRGPKSMALAPPCLDPPGSGQEDAQAAAEAAGRPRKRPASAWAAKGRALARRPGLPLGAASAEGCEAIADKFTVHVSGGFFADIFATGSLPVESINEKALSVEAAALGAEPGSAAVPRPAARMQGRLGPCWLAGAGGEGQDQVLSEWMGCMVCLLLHDCRALWHVCSKYSPIALRLCSGRRI